MSRRRVLLVTSELAPLQGGIASLCRVVSGQIVDRGWDLEVAAPIGSELPAVHPVHAVLHRAHSPWAVRAAQAHNARVLERLDPNRFDRILFMDAAARALSELDPVRWAGVSVYVHGTELCAATRVGEWISRRIERQRIALRRAGRVIANSNATRTLIEQAVPGVRVEVIHPAFDPRRVYDPSRPGSAPVSARGSRVVLLTVSRLVPRKGHERVLRALARCRSGLGDFVYLVVGDGPERPRLERLGLELGIGDRVRFVGAVDNEELGAYYGAADLFVMLSEARRDGVEGFGLTYIEAAASGVPSLASRHGGASEAVLDGVTGRTVDSFRDSDVDRALLELTADRELRRSLGQRARERALRELGPIPFVARLLEGPERPSSPRRATRLATA